MGVSLVGGKKPAKRMRWVRILVILIVIYTLAGFFLVPAILKSQMLKRLPGLTKRQVSVEQVRFNPYVLSLTIRGFMLKEPNGEVFASFDEFYVNFQLWASLFRRSWVFKQVRLVKPYGKIAYQEDGAFNFANLFESAPQQPLKSPKVSPPPAVRIYNLMITNGALALADLKHKAPFQTEIIPIELNLTNLTTIPNDNSPYSFYARAGSGETFAWEGTLGVTPPRSAGRFRVGGLRLKTYSTYSHDFARFEIVDGLFDVAADYRLAFNPGGQDLEVSNAVVHLDNLKLKDPSTGEIVVSVPAFSVTDARASLSQQTVWAGLVKTADGSILVRRNHDGAINLLSLIDLKPQAAAQVSNVVQTVIPWKAGADEVAIVNYAIKVEDKTPEKAVNLSLDKLNVDLKNVSDVPKAAATLSISMRYQETGTLAVNGNATFIPLTADLGISLSNVDLRPITPYVSQEARLLITGGAVDMHGRARYMAGKAGEPMASLTGDMSLTKFKTSDDVLFKDFTKWDSLTVSGVRLDVKPNKLAIDRVQFTGLNASYVIGPDGRANLQTILREKSGATNTVGAKAGTTTNAMPARAPATPLPDITLGELALDNASIHFTDESIEPHCSFDVQEFGGSIKGLSSKDKTTATVDVKGKVDERAVFSVSGRVNPLSTNRFADVTVNITNTDLTAFTPYMEKYVGRPLQKGKFSMTVHYLVETNNLKAENGFYLDQLTLGPKNNSTNATKLPVKLAIALLKDVNGRIVLNIPVNGRIDDPKFKLGPIIWQVVDNLLVRAATAPFKLLGSLFGGGDELSFVSFRPGSSIIPESETNKLETLAKSLQARPTVSLEISGSVSPTNERVPLARERLEDAMKSMWLKDLTDSGKPAIPLEEVKLDPREHERLLKKIYKERIGRYKPTVVATNLAGGLGSAATLLATLPPPAASDHGAVLLLNPTKQTVTPGKVKGLTIAGRKPAAPLTRQELQLADMEDQLMERIPITNDDLRDLMRARAARIQSYLLNTQKVTPDRLFITAPKPLNKTFKGDSRADLSLD